MSKDKKEDPADMFKKNSPKNPEEKYVKDSVYRPDEEKPEIHPYHNIPAFDVLFRRLDEIDSKLDQIIKSKEELTDAIMIEISKIKHS